MSDKETSNREDVIQKVVAEYAYLHAFTFEFAIILAGASIVFLGAATQVWEYPKLPTDFGSLAAYSGFLSFALFFLNVRMEDMDRRLLKRQLIKGMIWEIRLYLLVMFLTVLLAGFDMFYSRVARCLLYDLPICTETNRAIS